MKNEKTTKVKVVMTKMKSCSLVSFFGFFFWFFFLVSFFGWSGVEKHRLFVYCCFNASKDTVQLDLC